MLPIPVSRSADRNRIFWLLLILLGIGGPRAVLGAENRPPTVAAGVMVGGPGTRITVMTTPLDPEGEVDRVEFYEGDRWLGTASAPPYQLSLKLLNRNPLSLNFYVEAVDRLGARSGRQVAHFKSNGNTPAVMTTTNGLQLWLQAEVGVTTTNGTAVSGWKDQSPVGHLAGPLGAGFSPTGLEAPLWIQEGTGNVVRMDGLDDVLEIPSASGLQPGTDSWTVLWLGTWKPSNPATAGPLIGSRSGVTQRDAGWSVGFTAEGQVTSHFSDGTLGHVFVAPGSAPRPDEGERHLGWIEEDRSSRRTRAFLNGLVVAEASTVMPEGAVAPVTPVHLGRELFAGGGTTAVDLVEVLVFNRILSLAERESVGTYLGTKHEVSVWSALNAPPTVALTAPLAGQKLPIDVPVTLAATAADPDGNIVSVEFLANGLPIGLAVHAPFQIQTYSLPLGTNLLTVRAKDNLGAVTESAPIQITAYYPLSLTLNTAGPVPVLTWDCPATLEIADSLNGPWVPQPAATSPHSVPIESGQKYFRLRQAISPTSAVNYGYDPLSYEPVTLVTPLVSSNLPVRAIVSTRFLPPVGTQGTAANPGFPGSCAAWASTYGLATFTGAKRGNFSPTNASLQASPANIYIQVRELEAGSSNSCSGSKLTSYFEILAKGGTASLQTAPYTPSCPELWSQYGGSVRPPDPNFAVTNVVAVATTNLAAIKQILASDRVLAYGTRLYTEWGNYRGTPVPYVGTGIVAREADCKPVGHCMLIIGYDDERQAILIQNSEGPGWGSTLDGTPPNEEGTNGGYVWMAYSTFSALAQGTAFYHQE